MTKIKLNVRKEDIDKIVYSTDASMIKGESISIIYPENIEEIRRIVRGAREDIVPRGGGSGLVGGAVPQNSIVVDLSKMNKILEIDKEKKTVEVESGIILDDLQKELRKYGLEFPVDPSSHSICTIGGMIATNAIGNRGVKYKDTKNWVQNLDIIDGSGNLRKINKIDLDDIAGMEGVTGIIVRAKLKLSEIKNRTADLIEESDIDKIIEKVKELKRENDVSMIEFLEKYTSKLLGFPEKYHLIIEYESDRGKFRGEKYEELIKKRNMAYPILAKEGYTDIEDPKLYPGRIKEIILWLEQRKIPFFGHLGSGILHPCFKEREKSKEMLRYVKKLQGQITGEHGIGLRKKEFVELTDKKIIQNLKKRYDPNNKINKNKII